MTAAVAPGGAHHGGHGCMQGGLSAKLEASLTASLRGALLSTLADGVHCGRAEAHLQDLCKAAEQGKLCSGSFYVGHHSSSQIVAVLMHLVVQLMAFPLPGCTTSKGVQAGTLQTASYGTQTDVACKSGGTQTEQAVTVSCESQASPDVQERETQAGAAKTEHAEVQADAICIGCKRSPVLEEGTMCTGCSKSPTCGRCQQRVVPRKGMTCVSCLTGKSAVGVQAGADTLDVGMQARIDADCRSRSTQTDEPAYSRPSASHKSAQVTPACSRCQTKSVACEGDVCEDCADVILCVNCWQQPVAAPGDLCAGCTPTPRPRQAPTRSETHGVRIGGGYDILRVESRYQMVQETARSTSPNRDHVPSQFVAGAPPSEADAARFAVGTYSKASGQANILASYSHMLDQGLSTSGAVTGQQFYRVMLPALHGPGAVRSRPTSAPAVGRQVAVVNAPLPQDSPQVAELKAQPAPSPHKLSSRGAPPTAQRAAATMPGARLLEPETPKMPHMSPPPRGRRRSSELPLEAKARLQS